MSNFFFSFFVLFSRANLHINELPKAGERMGKRNRELFCFICIHAKHMKFILFFIASKLNYNHYHHGKNLALPKISFPVVHERMNKNKNKKIVQKVCYFYLKYFL